MRRWYTSVHAQQENTGGVITRFPVFLYVAAPARERHTLTCTRSHTRLTVKEKLMFISIHSFFPLPPSSRPDFFFFFFSFSESGLTNLALQLGTLNPSISFSLYVQCTTHTHGTAYTHTHAHTRSMFPLQSLSPAPGHPAHLWEQREHTLAWITVNHGAQIAPKERCCI